MICQLSARSPNSVAELVALDYPALLTLAEEVHRREEQEAWGSLHEELARIYDLLSVMRVEHLAGIGVKRWNLPEPDRMPRPDDKHEVRALTPGQAAHLMMVS
jgi:hypothetical protein